MSGSRRRFTAEYKIEAAHRVIDSGRSIAEVARELSPERGHAGQLGAGGTPPPGRAGRAPMPSR